MTAIPCFSAAVVESLAHVLGDCGTGSDIGRALQARGVEDRSGESTKWKRLNWVFLDCQRRAKCANEIIGFIQDYVAPARFVGRADDFEKCRTRLNSVLAFSGLRFRADGRFERIDAAQTLDEAERRVRTIRSKFSDRKIHPEVLKYCQSELMQDNYFHAVFEATKGLAQRIRDLSGVDADGAVLVDRAFSVEKPLLVFNTLQSETERSEQKGLAALIKGCFAAIRNPLAHGPKILWEGEDDAADYLSLVSLLHRRLDGAVRTGMG